MKVANVSLDHTVLGEMRKAENEQHIKRER